ncbi:methionine/alanine import family NSS transporter small subunit [Microbacterium sp. NPDC055910]|uniref:methionine/alanine import family NSS transporter small subunit n=1 Tax=Microbacterium sp. NPDC055910 TaxID=3345659 RepID=UPI0035D99745
MTPLAITFLVLSIIIVWGGTVVSALFLRSRPEVAVFPPGDPEDHRQDAGVIEHDT